MRRFHVPKWIAIAICAAATLRAIPALAAPGAPDTLVIGSAGAGAAGRHAGVSVGGATCPVVAGGAIDAAGAFQVVVGNCGPGSGTLTIDGALSRFTFAIRPGSVVTVGSVASLAPSAAPAAPANRPGAPATTAAPPASPVAHPATPSRAPVSPHAGSAGLSLPDGLVMGRVNAREGQDVTVSVGGKVCATVAGGVVEASGNFALVVGNCGPGPARLLVDGVATSVTFTTRPGGVVTVGR